MDVFGTEPLTCVWAVVFVSLVKSVINKVLSQPLSILFAIRTTLLTTKHPTTLGKLEAECGDTLNDNNIHSDTTVESNEAIADERYLLLLFTEAWMFGVTPPRVCGDSRLLLARIGVVAYV